MRFFRPAVMWFCIALVVRSVLTVAIHLYSIGAGFNGFFPLESGNDDRLYWEIALEVLSGTMRTDNPNSFGYFLAYLFSFTGPNLLVGKMLLVFAGAGAVAVAVLLVRELLLPMSSSYLRRGWRNPIHWAGAVMTFYPSALLYSTQLLRDPLMQFFGLLSVLMIVRFLRTRTFSAGLLALIALWLLYGLRPYLMLSIVFGTGLYMLVYWQIQPRIKWAILTISGLVFAFAPLALGLGVFGSGYVGRLLDPQDISSFRQDVYSTGGSAAGVQIDFSNPVSFVLTYPLSFLTAMFGPFPWQVKSAVQLIALPEALFMLTLIGVWWRGVRRLLRGSSRATVVFLAAMVGLAVVAVYSDNIGANTRLRLLPWSLFIVYASVQPYLEQPRKRVLRRSAPEDKQVCVTS